MRRVALFLLLSACGGSSSTVDYDATCERVACTEPDFEVDTPSFHSCIWCSDKRFEADEITYRRSDGCWEMERSWHHEETRCF